jgi:hypothetical protein
LVPELAELVRAPVGDLSGVRERATCETSSGKPYGEGWALVGDAGYHKDSVTAQEITDPFRSAELLSEAIHAGLLGARPLQNAMAEYQRLRDEQVAPMYDLTCEFASLKPPSSEMLALYQALRFNQPEADRFFGTIAGTVPIPEYYAPENLRRIVGGATARALAGCPVTAPACMISRLTVSPRMVQFLLSLEF